MEYDIYPFSYFDDKLAKQTLKPEQGWVITSTEKYECNHLSMSYFLWLKMTPDERDKGPVTYWPLGDLNSILKI